MKIIEAQKIYREQRQSLIDQRRTLVKQRDDLRKKTASTEEEKKAFADEAAKLDLSIYELSEKFDQNQEVLDRLTEQYVAIWNAEVAKQQGDAMEEAAVDLAKIMEVARRISKGAKVPASDEKKLMEYSMELYMSAKNLSVLNTEKKKKEYDSLWDDEEDEQKEEYDPQEKADNATVNIDLPDISVPEVSTE